MKQDLTPSIEDVRLDYVLIQAWKKTSSYLRSHSWYADTLGIDYESLRLPSFIKEIQNRLKQPENWESRPIMLVPAPKNQRWTYHGDNWEPQEDNVDNKMRPLAHVDLQDQVVATAIMLCLANRVESAMGNPCLTTQIKENRKKVLAYGHRLFCDQNNDESLCHRWGSSKIYRQYYQDYRTFLERPNIVAKSLNAEIQTNNQEYEIAIIQSDLSKFYDRVTPSLLWNKLKKYQQRPEETEFFLLAKRVFNWQWARNNKRTKQAGDILNRVIALPQGLVTAGFFANIVMFDFENALRKSLGKEWLGSGIILEDACYYVDDLRFVLRVPKGLSEKKIKENVMNWVQQLLNQHAKGLKIAENKTEVTVEDRDKQFLVKQSSEADRIQHQVSGPFDMQHGTEIIAAIEGFFRTQQRYSSEYNDSDSGLLIGIPDMKDETAARFAAGKFRRTFRSLRPLLSDDEGPNDGKEDSNIKNEQFLIPQLVLTKQQLDERAKLFSAQLIEEWVKNPANVRLLRIALDIYPDKEFLELILRMLRPGWETSRRARREVRLYCLAELFRAGATETGIVYENECLPGTLLVDEYHKLLIQEAHMIVSGYLKTNGRNSRFPWYLMQQVFLYLGSQNAFPETMLTHNSIGGNLLTRYWDLSRFMSGKVPKDLDQRAILLVLVKTGFGVRGFDNLGIKDRLSEDFLVKVNSISPEIAYELWRNFRENASPGLYQTAQRLGFEYPITKPDYRILAEISSGSENPFLDEENLLQLASWLFLKRESINQITPWKIICKYADSTGYEFGKIDGKSFDIIKPNIHTDLFTPPSWCESKEEKQKYQIGLILRYALLGLSNFNNNYNSKKQHYKFSYRRPISHWEQQRYSAVQGRDAFGPSWLPISSFTENLLFELLRWPGSGIMVPLKPIRQLKNLIDRRLNRLLNQRDKETSTLLLEQKAPWPGCEPVGSWKRPLRIGIIQSIIPTFDDYISHNRDPELNDKSIRSRQRAHLAAIMVAVENMLSVRETHCEQTRNDGRKIDLIIFPELAIHPDDIDRLVLPFVLKHKCIALFGQVYHKKDNKKDSPLINSCLWVIPEWSTSKGLQIRYIEQGKKNLTKPEKGLHPKPISFRPAQWLIEYQWNSNKRKRPLVLSASICYDATDLALAADLRSRSDIYIICALNQDVGTFDRMSDSLHYHMYQGVIVVNNGQYGGSNFFMPLKEAFRRQVFHIHGQPQVSISFVEISPEKLIKRPKPKGKWKTPPAGWLK
ncbi:MAG: RNA-directed DNA polymerase [Syntrophomonas sp.]